MKILIVKTSAIGDVSHTLPALHALRAAFPSARIDWLVEREAADIVWQHPALDRVLVSERRQWIAAWRAGRRLEALQGVFRLASELRAVSYDLLFDFQNLLKSSVFVALARARRKVGFGRGMEHAEMSYLFLNERIPAVPMDMHAVERELYILRAVGVPVSEVRFDLPLTKAHHRRAADILAAHGLGGSKRLIALNPMTTWPTKHWPSERFVHLADRLAAAGWDLVFTGGPADRQAIAEICGAMRRPAANIAGQTSLMELAAAYRRVRALVTTDTGPMHLAAAVGTPVVAVFGPTAPWRTGPYGHGHRVVRLALPCSPCYKRACPQGTHACMEQLAVEMVEEVVREVA